jgi:hypothetical protein
MEKEVLTEHLGEKAAEEVLKATKAYDAYIARFKKKMNKLLAPINFEVKTGIAFEQKPQGE